MSQSNDILISKEFYITIKSAWLKYANHRPECSINKLSGDEGDFCDCGILEIIKKLEKLEKEQIQ